MARAKSFSMMHHDSRELVEEVLRVERVTGVLAAIWFHVKLLLKLNVNSNLLPVISPRPPERTHTGYQLQIQLENSTVPAQVYVYEVPEAFEVQPENMRQLVDHQLFLCFS